MKSVIEGVGKEAPVEVTEKGGKHSALPYRFDLFDSKSMFVVANILKEGAEKYGTDNWRDIPVEAHINHLLTHTYAYLAGDSQDDHLGHALRRAMFALAVHLQEVPDRG